MSDTEKALCELTSIMRGKKESQQTYLKRLLTSLEKKFGDKEHGDDDWETLGATKGAQEWFNAAIKADKDDEPLPEFDTEDSSERKEPESEPSEVESRDADTKGKTTQGDRNVAKKRRVTTGADKAKTASTAAVKKPPQKASGNGKEAAAPRKQPGKAGGSLAVINQLMLKDPGQSVEDLEKALAKKGYKPTRLVVEAARSRIRQTFRVLQDEGHLKGLKL
jgi:hypothetical protein